MTTGLVSVIVPIYNHERFITDCLDSIARETWPEIELIAIDDGSRDRSFALAGEWLTNHAERFRRVHLARQDNVGITRTLNRLVLESRGEFVVPLASDDMLRPGGIAVRVAALRTHPKWLLAFGDCTVIDEDGNLKTDSALFRWWRRSDKSALLCQETIVTEMIWRWTVPGPVLMVRRDAYFDDAIGLYDETSILEDRDFYLRGLARRAVGFVDATVAAFRVHGANTGSTRSDEVISAVIAANRKWARRFSWIDRLGLAVSSFERQITLFDLRNRRRPVRKAALRAGRMLTSLVRRLVLSRNSRKARRLLATSQP